MPRDVFGLRLVRCENCGLPFGARGPDTWCDRCVGKLMQSELAAKLYCSCDDVNPIDTGSGFLCGSCGWPYKPGKFVPSNSLWASSHRRSVAEYVGTGKPSLRARIAEGLWTFACRAAIWWATRGDKK